MKDIERILKALANHRRLAIIRYLEKKGKASVGEIAQIIKLSFKSTSRHLTILTAADILDREQQTLNALYSLHKPLHSILKTVLPML